MPPIAVYAREFAATSALFGVKMLGFVVGIDDALATVAPNYEQIAGLWIDFSGHQLMPQLFDFGEQLLRQNRLV